MDDITKEIAKFEERVTRPLCEDIRRTLEVTCHTSGPDNHGSNFLGNATVLIGIETVAQFTETATAEEITEFKKRAKAAHKLLSDEDKALLSPRFTPTDGFELATSFMRRYFDQRFSDERPINDIPLFELVWAFRNAHAHAFYPYWNKTFSNGRTASGQVEWAYKQNYDKRIGVRIAEIEVSWDTVKAQLWELRGSIFHLRPQILFVYFKQALAKFIGELHTNEDLQNVFLQNYARLTNVYHFNL